MSKQGKRQFLCDNFEEWVDLSRFMVLKTCLIDGNSSTPPLIDLHTAIVLTDSIKMLVAEYCRLVSTGHATVNYMYRSSVDDMDALKQEYKLQLRELDRIWNNTIKMARKGSEKDE